jgi:hypothetical protein
MKIHAVSALGLETACGVRVRERLVRGESRIVDRHNGKPIHVSTCWQLRGQSDVSCANCLKVMP